MLSATRGSEKEGLRLSIAPMLNCRLYDLKLIMMEAIMAVSDVQGGFRVDSITFGGALFRRYSICDSSKLVVSSRNSPTSGSVAFSRKETSISSVVSHVDPTERDVPQLHPPKSATMLWFWPTSFYLELGFRNKIIKLS